MTIVVKRLQIIFLFLTFKDGFDFSRAFTNQGEAETAPSSSNREFFDFNLKQWVRSFLLTPSNSLSNT